MGTGTSSGVPMIACECEVCRSTDPRDNRLRSSILVESATTSLVVDTTPDFRYQMLRARVMKLDGIVFTHPHKDHIAGLDDVRAYNYFSKQPMQIFANEMTQMNIIREFPYAFAESKYPGVPEIHINPIDLEPFELGDISIIPILVWHMRMPVLGFRFGDFTYITDANRIDAAEMDKIRGSSHLVLNALRHEKHISHFTLAEAIEIVQELQVPNAWFTHISHQLGLHKEIDASLPAGIHLAYDGLKLHL
ncbi:MBL fold metallo-hydrolase [Flavihumibacter sp. UBA7668]|uniref:MBL fold metallo-hydrolase n=1 Tax=Flavihumibacter sp. UBA7668 TaxID=1946542 RepID=UPI0025BEC498|nr:MBL fold metallo-hydrolase [Flavihumibacter sp. UBA7668]